MTKKILALLFTCVLCLAFTACCIAGEDPVAEEDVIDAFTIKDLYFTNLPEHTRPENLLVLVFNYNNGYYVGSDEEIEQLWSDYIFGTGTRDSGTASINDYFREISYDKFYFNPILLGDNTTGVYSFHLDKDYSDEQGRHPEWPFFEFNYDMMGAFESLAKKGLDLNEFAVDGIDNENYMQILLDYYFVPQWERSPAWYSTSHVLCIFPTYNTEKWTPLSYSADAFTLYAHINFDSSWATIAHELVHTLGAIDTYNFGTYYSDIMSAYLPEEYGGAHVNPFYKIVFGWAEPKVVTESSTVTLFPATSNKYQPIIITTDDPNQYYIIENRITEKFDSILGDVGEEGIQVWRIDKFGCEAVYSVNGPRKGITLERVLKGKDDAIKTKYYANFDDMNDTQEVVSGVEITYIVKNADGSVEVIINI